MKNENEASSTAQTTTAKKETTTTELTPNKNKKKILNQKEYKAICDFILNFSGLTIECELEMILNSFTDVERLTLKSIVQTVNWKRSRSQYWRQEILGKKHLKTFEVAAANSWDKQILVKIAIEENLSPVSLCRAILQEKYQLSNKTHITRLLKYPSLIDDIKLAANVTQCLCSDSQEGPLIDLRRRVLGEEYEFKLKQMATAAGMHFYDENDLRQLGYDKTPDIKLILPFLYKDEVVNWIESKACFADPKTHKWYIQQQLNSYTNRFGPGIVIYWFGYRTDTPELSENSVGITVLDDFPKSEHMEFFNLNSTEMDDLSMNDACYNVSANNFDIPEMEDENISSTTVKSAVKTPTL